VKVVLPTRLSDEEKEAIRAIGAKHADDPRGHLL
jgi:hypothetical protein